jgi:hypothetical protein
MNGFHLKLGDGLLKISGSERTFQLRTGVFY